MITKKIIDMYNYIHVSYTFHTEYDYSWNIIHVQEQLIPIM